MQKTNQQQLNSLWSGRSRRPVLRDISASMHRNLQRLIDSPLSLNKFAPVALIGFGCHQAHEY